MERFYTRKGDDGMTHYLGEGRLPKDDPRIEALGSVDEANAALGVARNLCRAQGSQETLLQIQRDLYSLMGEVASSPENAGRFHAIGSEKVQWLEAQIEKLQQTTTMPRDFIVPGDSLVGAFIDQARAIVRRAERRVVELNRNGGMLNLEVLRYLNRLSSYCFILEIVENEAAGKESPTLARE